MGRLGPERILRGISQSRVGVPARSALRDSFGVTSTTRINTPPDALQLLVGGPLETVIYGDWQVCLNAVGMISNLPSILRASQLLYDCGLDLSGLARGAAVFLGNGDHGEEMETPEHLIRLAQQLFVLPGAA